MSIDKYLHKLGTIMTAKYIQITTRPSLNDVWLVELMQPTTTILVNGAGVDRVLPADASYPGYVSRKYTNFVTWQELQSRFAELRPDIQQEFDKTLPQIDNPDGLKLLPWVIRMDPTNKWSLAYSPFELTYTFELEYDTFDNLKFAYESHIIEPLVSAVKKSIKQSKNTFKEEFFDNDILTSYVGKLG